VRATLPPDVIFADQAQPRLTHGFHIPSDDRRRARQDRAHKRIKIRSTFVTVGTSAHGAIPVAVRAWSDASISSTVGACHK
jgi:hypothetical protein